MSHPKFRKHLFICAGKSCSAKLNGQTAKDYFKQRINSDGLKGELRACTASCLDYCDAGPNIIVYPEGRWYSGVAPEQWPAIYEELKKK